MMVLLTEMFSTQDNKWAEIDRITDEVRGSDYERIYPKGKAFLKPVHWRRQPNPTSDDYLFTLITGPVVYHFHTRTKTARSVTLNERAPHLYVEIHPTDAARLEIALGDLVEIMSPNGRWEGVAMVVNTVRLGEVFVPFHYGHGAEAVNHLRRLLRRFE